MNVYTPNSQDQLARLPYRMEWEDAFRAYLLALNAEKPVVVCGDMNVAHEEIDLKNPKTNRKNAGFSDEERAKFGALLDSGFRTPSARSIPTGGTPTPGGPTVSMRAPTTRDGASTISSSRRV